MSIVSCMQEQWKYSEAGQFNKSTRRGPLQPVQQHQWTFFRRGHMRCVLVSCCGLPAAGKTTFCRSVFSDSTNASAVSRTSTAAAAADSRLQTSTIRQGGAQIRVSHVCFDKHIDRARRRRRRRGENTLSSGTRHQQNQEEEEDEKERTDGQGWKDYRRGSDERDYDTYKQQRCGNGVMDTGMIRERHRSEGDTIEAHPVIATAQRAGLPEPAATSEGIGKDNARWWHEGRRCALAEIEGFAAQVQSGMTPPASKASPLKTSSSVTTNTGASAAEMKGGSRKEEPIDGAINPGFTISQGSPMTLKTAEGSDGSAEAPRHEVPNSTAAMAIAETMMAVSAERQDGSLPKEESTIHVVLADDNMHFRSMRHEVFGLARKYGCGYAQVYFPTDVEVAVERNMTRSNPVAEAVIRKMASNIQPPDPERFKWERHTAVVGPQWGVCSPDDLSITVPLTEGDPPQSRGLRANRSNQMRNSHDSKDVFEVPGEASRRKGAPGDVDALDSFWRTMAAAATEYLALPLSSRPSSRSLLDQEADRQVTRASLLHQFDLELREAVNRVAESATGAGLTRDVVRRVMSACSASRKQAMRRVRAAGNLYGHTAVSQTAQDEGIGVAGDHGGSEATAEDAVATHPTGCGVSVVRGKKLALSHGCLPHREQFVVEFEEALSTIDSMEQKIREILVKVARGPEVR